MIKDLGKPTRELISKKYLDWAAVLPKFQGGFIQELQDIRERQKKWSTRRFQNREKPDNATIKLDQIRFVITFQLEDFRLVRRAVSKLFPNSEKVSEFVKDLKNKESSVQAFSWNYIGLIVKDRELYVGEAQFIDTLPDYVRKVHVSYHRIMPSMACLSFSFYIDEKFSDALNTKQNRDYLPPVIFNNINPFGKFPRGYSMGGKNFGAREVVRSYVHSLASWVNKWLEKRTKINSSTNLPKAVVEHYVVKGNPIQDEELKKWLKTNQGWLGDYGISVSDHDSYKSSNLMYCCSSYPNNEWPVHSLVSFDDNKGEERDIDETMDALSVTASMYSTLDSIQAALEKHRKSGFQQLAKSDTKVLRNSGCVSKLKRLGVILNRISQEFKEGESWIAHSLEGIEDLTAKMFNEEHQLRKNTIDNCIYRIKYLRKAYKIVDIGLIGYLEVQNIYAMYRLQRWMFILSVVVTLATIVSAAASWDNLVNLLEKMQGLHNE